MTDTKLRFASIARVSTEAQKERGSSLEVQLSRNIEAVKTLGGVIVKTYSGNEHATSTWEQKMVDGAIQAGVRGEYDAIIFADFSRWSRDNLRAEQRIKLLADNNVRFFIGSTEYDLYDPVSRGIVGMNTVFNQMTADDFNRKALLSKILRARKGWPACGSLPYGRKFDKKTETWAIDGDIKAKVEQMAKTYLEEDLQFTTLAKRFGMAFSTCYNILVNVGGSKWVQSFKSKRFKINETVTIIIPPLLDNETIARIRAKSAARGKWLHGSYKHKYLLSRLIFDQDGNALTGTNGRYYRTFKGNNGNKGFCIKSQDLEKTILETLFETLGSDHNLQNAVFNNNGNGKVQELREKKTSLTQQLSTIDRQLSNAATVLLNYDGEDNVTVFFNTLKGKITDLEQSKVNIQLEIQKIDIYLANIPSKKEVETCRKHFTTQLLQRHTESYVSSGLAFEDLPFEEKRKLIRLIFGGIDESGKRFGVYVQKGGGFECYGRLGIIDGSLDKGVIYSDAKQDDFTTTAMAKIVTDNNPDFIQQNTSKLDLIGRDERI